jgi:hypothetical protein
MPIRKGLKRTKKKVERDDRAPTPKAQLKLLIDPELKKVLQAKYGRNLSKMYEEEYFEKMIREGYFTKEDKDAV